MNKRLGDDDASAVDLVFDRISQVNDGNGNGGGTMAYFTPVGDSVARRIGAVETVMRLLAEMPADEPPTGLSQRTIQRIEQAAATGSQQQRQHVQPERPLPPGIGEGSTHA